ncbi:MAG: chromate transporter [Deltaproteobacteria bacterium]|nr:chromate transporter [Deltaproteobacteria bacterium]
MKLVVLTYTFLRLSFLCIGGGFASIPEMQRQVVSLHGWLTAREFVDGFALSQLSPGPAMLISTFVGYRVAGIAGALLATGAMFLPTSLLAWVFVRHWARLRSRPWILAVERALSPLAVGLMAAGVYTLGRSAVTDGRTALLALAAALLVLWRRLPPVAVILAAGVVNWFLPR